MAKKHVFVSFDYENDKHYKFLLEAWDANKRFEFLFSDKSSNEICSDDISRVKAALTQKINQATYTLVIIGKEANKLHPDHEKIGFRNWINFEVHQSKLAGNKLVAVKLDKNNESPNELKNTAATCAMSFKEADIVKALNNV